jgi:PKD repeat protein
MTRASGVTVGAAGALSGDSDTAYSFNGTTSAYAATTTAVPGPQTFTVEAWFKTTSKTGGRVVGFGNASTGASSNYDRHIYLDTNGRLNFGVYPGALQVVTSTAAYNDGRWHHVAASLSSGGMALYVDGKLAASRTDITSAQVYNGYWRAGADNSWAGAATFNGQIDEVAVYPTALSASQVASHYTLGSTGTASNVAPTASFTTTVTDLTAAFDGSASSDRDGRVASYAWNFGDGATSSGVTATHAYGTAGTYQVTLTVTDDRGATGTQTSAVTVTPPPANTPPHSAFTISSGGRAVTVDGSASWDSDGTVTSYAWDFGDGAVATGATASHVYAADSTYRVTLTVTDDKGATASTTQSVTVAGPAVLASDSFGRSVTGGLGSADTGGAWSVWAGAARQSVAPGTATFSLVKGTNTGSYLGSVSQTSADVQTAFSLSAVPTGGGTSVYIGARRVSDTLAYQGRVRVLADGSVHLALDRLPGTTDEVLIGPEITVPGLTYTPGMVLHVRVQASGTGTTQLAASLWVDGAAEPAAPLVSATDSTAELQVAGAVGLSAYLSGSATAPVDVRFTSFSATPVA